MRALVLSGGGSNGAYQVGVLRELLNYDWESYDIIVGTSVGAINGAYLSIFPKIKYYNAVLDLHLLWAKGIKSTKSIWKWRLNFPLLRYLPGAFRTSLGKTDPLYNLLDKELQLALHNTDDFFDNGVQLFMPAVNLLTGELKVFTKEYIHQKPSMVHRQTLVSAIMASASYPLIFPPVYLDGYPYTDGGVRDIAPLKHAIDAGADEIVVIATAPENLYLRQQPKNTLQLAIASADIMGNEILNNDLQTCKLINYKVKNPNLVSLNSHHRHIDLHIFRPATSLGDSLDFSPDRIQALIQRGRDDTKLILTQQQEQTQKTINNGVR